MVPNLVIGPTSIGSAVLTGFSVQASGDKALGEYLLAECVTCHQLTGHSDGIPPIIGWPETGFVGVMSQFRNKNRHKPAMQTIAGRLSEEEIAAPAAYFGSPKSTSHSR